MKTLPYLEDYLAIMAGYNETALVAKNLFGMCNSDFSASLMSNEHRKFCSDTVDNILWRNQALTERQAVYAERIVRLYAATLNGAGYDVPDTFAYRFPLRVIDYSQQLFIKDNEIILRSKFNTDLVEQLRKFSGSVNCNAGWDHENKVWKFGITEESVSWLVCQCQIHKIPVSDDVMDLFNLIVECEENKYAIELDVVDGEPVITNAADSIIEYLTEQNAMGDILKMVDYSSVCGYTVNKDVLNALSAVYKDHIIEYCAARTIECPKGPYHDIQMDKIIDWAIEVGRFPIVVYNPTTVSDLKSFDHYFAPDEVLHLAIGEKPPEEIPSNIKLIVTRTSIKLNKRIPLLISSVSLLFGKKARELSDAADKIVWNCVNLKDKLTNADRKNRYFK